MRYGTIDFEYAGFLASQPAEEDGPIWMVNFMRYLPVAEYEDGEGEAISGKEADDRYAPTEVLAALGADVAYFGDVLGVEGTEDRWDRMAIVRYPTRRSFIEMQERSDFKEKRVHKDAGMEFTVIMCSLPIAPAIEHEGDEVRFVAYPADAAPEALSPHGATFDVEGTVIGDERRWDRLVITRGPLSDLPLPEGTMVVRSTPGIDRVDELVADSLAR